MPDQTTAEQVQIYCAQIGVDALLVQGAGGNVSWKDGEVLWVKASGTWLAQAEKNDIFIPVDLVHLKQEITKKNFAATPKVVGNSNLRPSIETMLHALMPHKIVVHLHAVEILAYLVRENPVENFKKLIGDSINWIFVDYFKPGADLAQAVADQLVMQPGADVVFLKSHGLVIGGVDIESIERTLSRLLSLLKTETLSLTMDCESEALDSMLQLSGYVPCGDKAINQLAIKKELAARLATEWALYPDHVVFLGGEAAIIDPSLNVSDLDDASGAKPPFVFAIGQGVYENVSATDVHKAQLRCYYDVLARQAASEKLQSLSNGQVAELLNWDAEKYRQKSLYGKRGA